VLSDRPGRPLYPLFILAQASTRFSKTLCILLLVLVSEPAQLIKISETGPHHLLGYYSPPLSHNSRYIRASIRKPFRIYSRRPWICSLTALEENPIRRNYFKPLYAVLSRNIPHSSKESSCLCSDGIDTILTLSCFQFPLNPA